MHIGFYSTLSMSDWGGSEELWSQCAEILLRQGHQVSVDVSKRQGRSAAIGHLRSIGADIHMPNRRGPLRPLRRLAAKAGFASNEVSWLRRCRPDLVMVSVSWHLDELPIAQACADLGVPYVLLVQAASPHHWVRCRSYAAQRQAYAGAAACYFVSQQNRETVESNLALDLSDARIVDNAFGVALDTIPQWPDEQIWKLACVGRISFQSKGQDLLVNVLKQPKWKARPLQISLWGVDEGNLRQIRDLIDLHDLGGALKIGGFASDIASVWADNHGLILPSRYEGNPLAMIEAMVCGRIPIVTDIGRASELIDDDETGFIAAAPTTQFLDDAMERAWARRHEWQEMGASARQGIMQRHSMTPGADLANLVVEACPARQTVSSFRLRQPVKQTAPQPQ